VEVAERVGAVDGHQPDLVGRADPDARADAAAGHPDGEPGRVVLAAAIALHHRGPAELARPDDQRRVEQPALFQVGEQRGDPARPSSGRGAGGCSSACRARPSRPCPGMS
jgi:hypothetical protein